MNPVSHSFLQAARKRLRSAQYLEEGGFFLDAMYLGGYAIECSLKALILHLAKTKAERQELYLKISSGASMHYAERLNVILSAEAKPIPAILVKKLRPFEWSTDLRYEPGRKSRGMARGFLKVASRVLHWVEGELL